MDQLIEQIDKLTQRKKFESSSDELQSCVSKLVTMTQKSLTIDDKNSIQNIMLDIMSLCKTRDDPVRGMAAKFLNSISNIPEYSMSNVADEIICIPTKWKATCKVFDQDSFVREMTACLKKLSCERQCMISHIVQRVNEYGAFVTMYIFVSFKLYHKLAREFNGNVSLDVTQISRAVFFDGRNDYILL
jgi:hypothetical protein